MGLRGICKWLGVWALLQTASAQAVLNIEIVGAGEHQIPIAITPLAGSGALVQTVNEVVGNDLTRTGLFRLLDVSGQSVQGAPDYAEWQQRGAEALSFGSLTQRDNRIEAQVRLLDVVKQTELSAQVLSASADQPRALAHRIADLIYEKLTGDPGVFSTRIAYVNRQGQKFQLVVADSDGQNEQVLLSQNQPIMSPAWSPDGNSLAYVSFETRHAVVYVQSVYNKQRKVVADFRGSNSAPAWSPDGKQMAIVVGHDGGSQIYLLTPGSKEVQRISSGGSIETEPNFSPDGQWLLFTSDRGGSPQIYRMPAKGGAVQRLTFGEGNNYSPRYSPDGKSFVFTHQEKGKFVIAIQDLQSGQMERISAGGWEKKPSYAPNGKLVIYASEAGGRGILTTASVDGRVKQKMATTSGDAREPIWGPRL